MLPFARQSGSARPILLNLFLASLALVALSRPAAADPATVEVRDADGETWEIVIDPADPSFVAAQPDLPLAQVDEADDDGQPEVVPQTFEPGDEVAPADDERPRVLAEPQAIRSEEHGIGIVAEASASSTYADLYRSIPFSRAEYDANPSYRHDAVMEILTGNPRPARCCPATAAPYAPGLPFGPAAYPYYPLYGYRPYIPTFAYRVFPYPAFGYRSRYRYYPAGFGYGLNYGLNYNLW